MSKQGYYQKRIFAILYPIFGNPATVGSRTLRSVALRLILSDGLLLSVRTKTEGESLDLISNHFPIRCIVIAIGMPLVVLLFHIYNFHIILVKTSMGKRASIRPKRDIYSIEELTSLYKKEKSARMQKRLLAIKMMLEEEKLSSYDVARRLSVSPTSIRDWVSRYNEGGYETLKESGPRGGKPNISDEELLKVIEEIELENKKWTLESVALLTQQRYKRGLKKSAVWYRLKKMGIGVKKGDPVHRQGKETKI